jgi:hypothetical protein
VLALDEVGAIVAASAPLAGDLHEAAVVWNSGGERLKAASKWRFRIELERATLFALDGVTLVDETLPEEPSSLREELWKPHPVKEQRIDFTADAAGWKGVDEIVHLVEGDASGGFVRFSRAGRNLPIALSGATPETSPLAGAWPEKFGGRGAEISVKVRAPRGGGRVQIEVFAQEVAQWTRETNVNFGSDWREAKAELRYGWTDDEAAAAGWRRSAMGFSWEETMRHVGKIVIVPSAAGPLETFDLDEVVVRGVE